MRCSDQRAFVRSQTYLHLAADAESQHSIVELLFQSGVRKNTLAVHCGGDESNPCTSQEPRLATDKFQCVQCVPFQYSATIAGGADYVLKQPKAQSSVTDF